MSGVLHLLPTRTAGAAENMALDFLLLQSYPTCDAARFRHYDWFATAFTFGYSQRVEFVRANLPAEERVELCRRPTGGGIVDHRNDWTYALAVPRGHPVEESRATESYRLVHEALAVALVELGQPAEVKLDCEPPPGDKFALGLGLGVCFRRAELYDVVNRDTGAKVAGAAQRRNKRGLLFQGSIDKTSVGAIDWDVLQKRFAAALVVALAEEGVETPWPEFNDDEATGLVEHYSSTKWLEYR